MIDGNDYRGAVAESKQKILVPDITLQNFGAYRLALHAAMTRLNNMTIATLTQAGRQELS